jgi:hypothetical protein
MFEALYVMPVSTASAFCIGGCYIAGRAGVRASCRDNAFGSGRSGHLHGLPTNPDESRGEGAEAGRGYKQVYSGSLVEDTRETRRAMKMAM